MDWGGSRGGHSVTSAPVVLQSIYLSTEYEYEAPISSGHLVWPPGSVASTKKIKIVEKLLKFQSAHSEIEEHLTRLCMY